MLLFAQVLMAQTCTGSVGDPIVNVTFGAGNAVNGPPLPAGTTTNLIYVSQDCPADGFYTITNQTNNCFGNTWYSLTDHTGDPNGYFMLINASFAPSSFYLQTIDGLCTGTTYQFAAWIANMCNFASSIRPNITFTIEKTDSTVLSSYNTGDIPIGAANGLWQRYGFNFTMPVGVSTVVLRMKNNAPGGIGNDLSLDDITFRPIGPAISVSTLDFTGDTAFLCVKDTKNLTFHSTVEQCYAATGYQWQVSTDNGNNWTDISGATNADYTRQPTAAGTYQYRLTVAEQNNIGTAICRVVSKKFTVIIYGENVRTISIAEPAGATCQNNPVTFTATTTYAGDHPSFQWMLNNAPVSEGNDSVFISGSLSNGDKVYCFFTSSLPCNNAPLNSNIIPVTILAKAHSQIDTSVCEGETYEGYTSSGTYTDVFPGSNGCDSTRTLNLVVYPKQSSLLDTSICFGTMYSGLSAEGSYSFTYQSIHGCDSVHTIVLHVLPDIYAKPNLDTILCAGDSIIYSPGNFDSYYWQDGSIDSSYTIVQGGNYSVTATNKCGTAVKNISVAERICIVNFPSAFTPNGDGRNDMFRMVNAYDVTAYHCVIVNRWGQKIFESFDPMKGWDGTINAKAAESGTYIWFCDYANKNKPGILHLKGTVVLIR